MIHRSECGRVREAVGPRSSSIEAIEVVSATTTPAFPLQIARLSHSYTNREIDAMGMSGFAYDEKADRRAWKLMLSLFDEVLT